LAKASSLQSMYKIKLFTSSSDKDFIKALKIYNDTIPAETKTSTNEITTYVDKKSDDNRDMYFFGLYFNDEVIGYVESGYLKITKTLIIDYFVLKEQFNYNSIFYPLFSLFQKFFSDNLIDIEYFVSEVSVKTLEQNVDKESYYLRKLLQVEDFRLIDLPYSQPRLGHNNYESNFNLRLMIKSTNSIYEIRNQTFMSIIEDIYINHYLSWYSSFFIPAQIEDYQNHIDNLIAKIKANLNPDEKIRLNILPIGTCEHYMTAQCFYKSNEISTAGFAKNNTTKHINLTWIIGIPLVIIFAIAFTFLLFVLLEKFKMKTDDIAPLLTPISSIFTGILALAFSNKTSK